MKNTRSVCFFSLSAILALALSMLPLAASAQIANASNGQPVIATSATMATSDGTYLDALVYTAGSTSDMCTRIEKTWANLPTPGGVIDARGFTGAQSCLVSPFPPITSPKYGILLLGNAQISTAVTWNIPTRVRVQGIGSQGGQGTASGTELTLIYASSSSFSGPVVQLGYPDGSGDGKAYQSQVADLTIDCTGAADCIGLLNDSAEEASYAQNIIVFNAPTIGVHITTAYTQVTGGAANSGPYQNISIQYTTCSCTSAIGLQVDGGNTGQVVRGFDNFTVSGLLSSGEGISEPGILVYGTSTEITNSHVEYFGPGIQIGNTSGSYSTENVEVQNVNISNNQSSWDVLVQSSTSEPVGDVLLVGVNNGSSNNQILDDTVTGNKITGSNLGFYLLGDINTTTPANTAVISTTATVSSGSKLQWVDPGNLDIIGSITKGSGTFEIDHPLDPGNKYLKHSFVESPDMMNVYNGNVTTDKRGLAVVTLPNYFQALNKDFRYQLTAMGTFAQATVAREIHDNQFTIRTSKPDVKVSWQVTGVRHDAYAEQNPVQVEEEKSPRDRGHYLHPEAVNTAQQKSQQPE
jgi:hypothetical protein